MERDQLSTRLLQIFLEELSEHIARMNSDLLQLEEMPKSSERLSSLFRTAHTLKGAARSVNVQEIETACHAMEERLASARDEGRGLTQEEIELLLSAADALEDAGDRLREGRPLRGSAIARFPARVEEIASGEGAEAARPARTESVEAPSLHDAAPTRDTRQDRARDEADAGPISDPGEGEPETPGRKGGESRPSATDADPSEVTPQPSAARPAHAVTVRVDPNKLDDLLSTAAEVMALGRRADARANAIQEIEAAIARHGGRISGERRPPVATFQPGAATVTIADPTPQATTREWSEIENAVRRLSRDASTDARHLGHISEQLTSEIRALRMRPVLEAFEGLPRTVRDVAASAGKEVGLEIESLGMEADRTVLEALREAVLPIVRNAIDHGIEPPEERKRKGKPERGVIRISGELSGDHVTVTVEDDGAGIDVASLRERVAATGAEVPTDDRKLAQILLSGGISSRDRATRISGRGVGLDIVRGAMERVRGTAHIEWEAGSGTRIHLEFPPSLASLRALLVGVGSEVFAIPTLATERLARVAAEDLASVEGRPVLRTDEGPIPVTSLSRTLGPPLAERPVTGILRLVILRARRERFAFIVDELHAEEELVLRPVRTGRFRLPLVAAAAVLPSGGVAPLLDVPGLIAAARSAAGTIEIADDQETVARQARRILVADDSLTTRTLEQSLLESGGYLVTTAVDGLDAWGVLQENEIDLVVSDVEMPRMDGFQLCERVRATPRLREIPLILVTARENPEDRARGLEAGADAYLAKSSFDQEELLRTVRELIA